MYTWGEPRVGDAKFRDVFNAAYGDRCFRIRNAGAPLSVILCVASVPVLLRPCSQWHSAVHDHVAAFELLCLVLQAILCRSCCHSGWDIGAHLFFLCAFHTAFYYAPATGFLASLGADD